MEREKLIEINLNKLGGTPVFSGTRVPVQNLFDCLEAGERVDEFLEQFPTVTREQVVGVLKHQKKGCLRIMKLLLDECVTRKLKNDFAEHDIHTVDDAGMKGLENGKLLQAAAGIYDVLITVDRNIEHQQNIASLNIAILVLAGKKNDYATLRSLVPQALETLNHIKAGEIITVS